MSCSFSGDGVILVACVEHFLLAKDLLQYVPRHDETASSESEIQEISPGGAVDQEDDLAI